MRMESLSPVVFVGEIEPCLPFWTDRLGFEVQAAVENEGRYDFVLLLKDGVQLMYQTRRSLGEDLPQLEERDHETSVFLYLRVDDIDAIEQCLDGVPRVQPRRETFYGATEVAVREPAGNPVVFAEFGRQSS